MFFTLFSCDKLHIRDLVLTRMEEAFGGESNVPKDMEDKALIKWLQDQLASSKATVGT